MNRSTRLIFNATMACTILAFTATTATPASASRIGDDGPVATVANTNWNTCQLRRIGNQLIRCDSLTGAGVSAPSWIPQ